MYNVSKKSAEGIKNAGNASARSRLRTTTRKKKTMEDRKPAPMMRDGDARISSPAPCITATSKPMAARQMVIVLLLSGTEY